MDTDQHWKTWGEIDPYYGVLSTDRYRKENIDQNRDQFFQSGEAIIAEKLARYEQSFGTLPSGRVLDFGSGVGRLTIPLAKRFESALGLDIAPAMIAEAKCNAQSQGVSNVDFLLSDDELTNAQGQFAFVNSYLVLQHIPVVRGMKIIAGLVDKVAPGGGFLIHFSVRKTDFSTKAKHWARNNIPFSQQLYNIARGRAMNAPLMEMNAYPAMDVLEMLEKRGIDQAHLFLPRSGPVLTVGLIGMRPA